MSADPKAAPRAHVLVVEDSIVFREMQTLLLGQAGYAVSAHEHPQAALTAARQKRYDLVIIDYELPEMNGQQFMVELRKILPDIAIIFVSGSLTLELAITLSRQGVAGIFNKPANPKTLLEKINETLSRTGSREATLPGKGSVSPVAPEPRRAAAAPAGPAAGELAYQPKFFPGACDAFREFTHRLWKVRDFRSALLLQGEAGTPFELIARDLAAISVFREGPVMVCPAARFETRHLIEVLAPTLLSQDAGTLIVTGVESLTAEQQVVLNILTASREMFLPFARRFRLVLAATGHLSDLADAGTFDETLFYKISSLAVEVPALRELRGDILLHVRLLLDQLAAETKAPKSLALTNAAAAWLEEQEWLGNYADFARTVRLAAAATTGPQLDVPALESSFKKVLAEAGQTAPPLSATPAELLAIPVPIEETPPPFSMRPAATPAAAPAPAPRPAPAPVPNPVIAVTPITVAPTPPPAAAPAPSPSPAKAPLPKASGLTARGMFRPVVGTYDFSKRLAESLSAAESGAAS